MAKSISPRASQRRAVVKSLKQVKEYVSYMLGQWNVTGRVYDPDAERRTFGITNTRERTADEYPENSATKWRALAAQCDELRAVLEESAHYARMMAREIEREQGVRP